MQKSCRKSVCYRWMGEYLESVSVSLLDRHGSISHSRVRSIPASRRNLPTQCICTSRSAFNLAVHGRSRASANRGRFRYTIGRSIHQNPEISDLIFALITPTSECVVALHYARVEGVFLTICTFDGFDVLSIEHFDAFLWHQQRLHYVGGNTASFVPNEKIRCLK